MHVSCEQMLECAKCRAVAETWRFWAEMQVENCGERGSTVMESDAKKRQDSG